MKCARGPINCLDCDKVDGRYLLSGSADTTLHIYDLEEPGTSSNAETLRTVEPIVSLDRRRAHQYSITNINWFPFDTGTSLTHIRLLDLRTGSSTHTLTNHSANVLSLAWSPRDEFFLASGGEDGCIWFWDIRKARAGLLSLDMHNSEMEAGEIKLASMTAHTASVNGLTFTSDGLHLLSSGHDSLRLWDVFSGCNTLTNYGTHTHNTLPSTVYPYIPPLASQPLLFHPSDNKVIHVFDLFTGELMMTLRGHRGRVACVIGRDILNVGENLASVGEGANIFSGSYDGTVGWWIDKVDFNDE
ncbi:DNA excision repair protein ERCC-8 [Gaertneriomyces sp. JEL0708]|nr:DNA excision repair protein ERCC-8 [Gaertneriomyces sp. JEL0708]